MSHHHDHSHHSEDTGTTKDKLKILLKHWKDHNNSHILEYEKWIKRCEEESLMEQAEILKKVVEKLKEINLLYDDLSRLV